jgi:hypothetical protein
MSVAPRGAEFSEGVILMRIEIAVATLAEKHGVSPALVHDIMTETADIILYELATASFWMHVWIGIRSMCGCCCGPVPSLREPRV